MHKLTAQKLVHNLDENFLDGTNFIRKVLILTSRTSIPPEIYIPVRDFTSMCFTKIKITQKAFELAKLCNIYGLNDNFFQRFYGLFEACVRNFVAILDDLCVFVYYF